MWPATLWTRPVIPSLAVILILFYLNKKMPVAITLAGGYALGRVPWL